MTKEVAIMELKRFSGTTTLRLSANFWEALNTAIKALEQEPCEDAVSRQAVIKHICEEKFCYKENCKGVLYNRCPDITWVNDLPSVQSTRKKGKWIEEPNCYLRCSCCNSHYPHVSIYAIRGSKYCPNCGAEMESEE